MKYSNLIWLLLFVLLSFAALNRHSRSEPYSYQSQLMSDKAGHYVFLPAAFLYHFEANKFPTNIDTLTGSGFYLDSKTNKLASKYAMGTALLEMPFFLGAHIYVTSVDELADGFSKSYQNAIDIAAVFYLVLGLFLLSKFLQFYFSQKATLVSLFVLLFGTNLYYYACFEGAYSHVYSFFLFSSFLYVLKLYHHTQRKLYWYLLILSIGGVILTRQVNGLFIVFGVLLLDNPIKLFEQKKPSDWVFGTLLLLLVLMPQFAYNIYLNGSLFFDSYQKEGFIYWLSPKIKEVLLGFHNGLFTTNPILVLSVLGLVPLFKLHKSMAALSFLVFLACTLLYASWWAWNLGCAYGHRGFVDVYPFLVIPITALFQWVQTENKRGLTIGFYVFSFLAMAFNMKYIYTYDSCWPIDFTQSDFEIYWHYIWSPTK